MAVKKKTSNKTKRKPSKSRKKKHLGWELTKAGIGLIVLMLLVVLGIFMVRHFLTVEQADREITHTAPVKQAPVPTKKAKVHKPDISKAPPAVPLPYEVYPEKEIPHHKPVVETRPTPSPNLPRVAIIIDDLGFDSAIADQFIRLDVTLTFSILPYGPLKKKIADAARAKGVEVLLHLPMEPLEYPRIDPGPGALLTTMSPDELIRQLNADLDGLPHVIGVNNHMGSKMTSESDRMNQIFSVLKQRNLFFIDSRTTAKTQSSRSARLFKVPFAQRDVFLDHVQQPEYIRSQVDKLIRYAESHGEAIGIGHPHAVTFEVLRELLPKLKGKIDWVPASRIVRVAG